MHHTKHRFPLTYRYLKTIDRASVILKIRRLGHRRVVMISVSRRCRCVRIIIVVAVVAVVVAVVVVVVVVVVVFSVVAVVVFVVVSAASGHR